MLEKEIEEKVGAEVKKLGGKFYKFTSMSRRSVPDRLVILPFCPMFFIEFKAPGQKPTPKQSLEHKSIRALGVDVYVVDSVDEGKKLVRDYLQRMSSL
jgi:hypothetical protein